MQWLWRNPASVDNHHHRSDQEYRKSQLLPTRERSKIETDLRIRFAHEFNQEPEQSIERHQRPKDRASIEILFVNPSQDDEQYKAFEQRFVDLRWMPRHGAAFRKHHSPRDIRWPSEQFTIDEIADAAQAEADGDCRTDEIRDRPKIPSLPESYPHRG